MKTSKQWSLAKQREFAMNQITLAAKACRSSNFNDLSKMQLLDSLARLDEIDRQIKQDLKE